MIECRTCFQFFETPDDADVFDHIIHMIDGFQATRPTDITLDKFSKVDDALSYGYPVSAFGSLNSSNSAALQSNDYLVMPGFLVMKMLLAATLEDYDFIQKTEHQPPWLSAICGTKQPPILVGHEPHGAIEHSKVWIGNVPIWDGKTKPGDTVQLGFCLHSYGFTHIGVAQAAANAILRGVILLPSVGDGSQAGQKAAIDCYSLILNAWIKRPLAAYGGPWLLYDPIPVATTTT